MSIGDRVLPVEAHTYHAFTFIKIVVVNYKMHYQDKSMHRNAIDLEGKPLYEPHLVKARLYLDLMGRIPLQSDDCRIVFGYSPMLLL